MFWDTVKLHKARIKNSKTYEQRELEKRKETRLRKNKRNSRGRTQTQGAALGAVGNILGG